MAVQRFLILFGKLRSLRLSAEVSFKRFQQFRNCSVNVFERFVHVRLNGFRGNLVLIIVPSAALLFSLFFTSSALFRMVRKPSAFDGFSEVCKITKKDWLVIQHHVESIRYEQ